MAHERIVVGKFDSQIIDVNHKKESSIVVARANEERRKSELEAE